MSVRIYDGDVMEEMLIERLDIREIEELHNPMIQKYAMERLKEEDVEGALHILPEMVWVP